jgi:hypothetical protein
MIQIVGYDESLAAEWDQLVAESVNGTFMHTRRFLGYHRDRFQDASVLIRHSGRTVAVLPAAVDPSDSSWVNSHPGLTYGGLVRLRRLSGEELVEALQALAAHYVQQGFQVLRYKAIPTAFQRLPAADDSYALQRLGASRYRCDLSSVIALSDPTDRRNENRRRGHKLAVRAGLTVCDDIARIPEYWDVLQTRLAERYGVKPVHTVEEITEIASLFPSHMQLVTGLLAGKVVAGVVLFRLGPAVHIQYSGSSDAGREIGALDAVTWHAIQASRLLGAEWFSFGVSTESEGRVLNSSLYRFKESFGATGLVHEHFQLPLP